MSEESDPTQSAPQEPPSAPSWNVFTPDSSFAGARQSGGTSRGASHAWLPPTPEEAATLFPGYTVLRLLGRGGMGAVYQARQVALDRLVAIKLLPLEISGDQDFADRFRREARAMARLDHPNIIAVYDFGATKEGQLYFVMAFVEGANLAEIIHRIGLSTERALSVVEQVCTALAYAHSKGIVHRDIKPANVMIDTDNQVKVADFGLARLTGASAEMLGRTMTGLVMGTPDYMAPEQMEGMNVDQRADVYSVGVMLYETLCRQVPKGSFDSPSKRTGCDVRIDQIVVRATQQSPALRYQSTQAMKADIAALRTLTVIAPPTPKPAIADSQAPAKEPAKAIPATAVKKTKLPLFAGIGVAVAALVCTAIYLKKPLNPAGEPRVVVAPSSGGESGENVGGKGVPPTVVSAPPGSATMDKPFVNSLGMKLVPAPILGGPTGGQRVLFSVWDTRVQDYEVFVKDTRNDWPKTDFPQGPTHPAVNVSWEDTQLFCQWLTARDQAAGLLPAEWRYRLPSDHEWSCAVDLGEKEDPAETPAAKNGKIGEVFPWGAQWPPPKGAGNYAGEELRSAPAGASYAYSKDVISGHNDTFVNTSPVGSFTANRFGLFDMGGNVWQWCEDWYGKDQKDRVLRGASWDSRDRSNLLSSARDLYAPGSRHPYIGFRCVASEAARAAWIRSNKNLP